MITSRANAQSGPRKQPSDHPQLPCTPMLFTERPSKGVPRIQCPSIPEFTKNRCKFGPDLSFFQKPLPMPWMAHKPSLVSISAPHRASERKLGSLAPNDSIRGRYNLRSASTYCGQLSRRPDPHRLKHQFRTAPYGRQQNGSSYWYEQQRGWLWNAGGKKQIAAARRIAKVGPPQVVVT
jgi:hypothetical protein